MSAADDSPSGFDERAIDVLGEAPSDVHRRRLSIALWEPGPDGDAVRVPAGQEDAERYHIHLPGLQGVGLMERSGDDPVAREPRFDAIEDFGGADGRGSRG